MMRKLAGFYHRDYLSRQWQMQYGKELVTFTMDYKYLLREDTFGKIEENEV